VSTLYLIATPIGNLEDISSRALKTLAQVSLIAAEDTRQTRKLLNHYNINTLTISYYEHNKLSKIDRILTALQQTDVALVSDAGTPALNDPGYELVKACLEAGHQVSPIPGPCAPIAALVASGLPTDSFLFLGYLPRKSSARVKLLEDILDNPFTLIFLETPHRLVSALKDLLNVLGDRRIAVARELTKIHEEIYRGNINEAIHYFTETPPRGEFTLIIDGKTETAEKWTQKKIENAIEDALKTNRPSSEIAREISKASGWERRTVYKLIPEIQNDLEE
jgi:16S rRNA (cytidine1402-2'-O)-methyltransferase